MKPPFSYFGGKIGAAAGIARHFPPHRVYIEPFFGSGAVFFAKTPAVHEIVNDVDRALVTFLRVLRDRPDDLLRVCELTPHARVEFDMADLDAPCEDLELARRFWVRVNQSFAKTAGRQTGWSVATARSQAVPASIGGRLTRFHAVARRLMNTTIECCNAADLVTRLATDDTVIYLDPPYVHETRRRGRSGTAAADYRCEMTNDEHRALGEVLRTTPATVFLSGYHSDLYEDLYGDWPRIEWNVLVHSSNAVTSDRGERVEVLWSNRPFDHEVQGVLL